MCTKKEHMVLFHTLKSALRFPSASTDSSLLFEEFYKKKISNLFLYYWRNSEVAKKKKKEKAGNWKVKLMYCSFRPKCCQNSLNNGWQCAVTTLCPSASCFYQFSFLLVCVLLQRSVLPSPLCLLLKDHVCKEWSSRMGLSLAHAPFRQFLLSKIVHPQEKVFPADIEKFPSRTTKVRNYLVFLLALPHISRGSFCCLTGQLNEGLFQRRYYKGHWPLIRTAP